MTASTVRTVSSFLWPQLRQILCNGMTCISQKNLYQFKLANLTQIFQFAYNIQIMVEDIDKLN